MAFVSQQDKKALAPGIKRVLNKYGMKGTLAVRDHMTLVCNIKAGKLDFSENVHGKGYTQVNPYWIDKTYSGEQAAFLTELLDAMKGPNYYCEDDIQTDYFSRSHYTDINIGSWDKPYEKV